MARGNATVFPSLGEISFEHYHGVRSGVEVADFFAGMNEPVGDPGAVHDPQLLALPATAVDLAHAHVLGNLEGAGRGYPVVHEVLVDVLPGGDQLGKWSHSVLEQSLRVVRPGSGAVDEAVAFDKVAEGLRLAGQKYRMVQHGLHVLLLVLEDREALLVGREPIGKTVEKLRRHHHVEGGHAVPVDSEEELGIETRRGIHRIDVAQADGVGYQRGADGSTEAELLGLCLGLLQRVQNRKIPGRRALMLDDLQFLLAAHESLPLLLAAVAAGDAGEGQLPEDVVRVLDVGKRVGISVSICIVCVCFCVDCLHGITSSPRGFCPPLPR